MFVLATIGKNLKEKVTCLVDSLSYFRLHQELLNVLLSLIDLRLRSLHVLMALLDARRQAYSAAIYAQLRSDSSHISFFRPQHGNARATRACYHNVHAQKQLSLPEIAAYVENNNLENGVLVVENVNLEWCIALGVAFGIDHTFFVEHASNPPGDTPWEAIIGDWSEDRRRPTQNGQHPASSARQVNAANGLRDRWHVDGVLEYELLGTGQYAQSGPASTNLLPRSTSYSKNYGWSVGTRVSYILANPSLCMSLALPSHFSRMSPSKYRSFPSGCSDSPTNAQDIRLEKIENVPSTSAGTQSRRAGATKTS
jgi:hypothetical protein